MFAGVLLTIDAGIPPVTVTAGDNVCVVDAVVAVTTEGDDGNTSDTTAIAVVFEADGRGGDMVVVRSKLAVSPDRGDDCADLL